MPRRKPFSSKQRKTQLQQKRQKKKAKEQEGCAGVVEPDGRGDSAPSGSGSDEEVQEACGVAKLNQQPGANVAVAHTGGYDANRYRLHFQRESKEEVERRKLEAKTVPLTPLLPETAMEVGVEDVYRPGSVLDLPKRPAWSYSMTKEEVEGQEAAMFDEYLDRVYSLHGRSLSHFEHNLETWRQLWRVLEISDVVLLITDVRHPALHFSPAFYSYVVDELKKQVILVLNKVDLVPAQVAVAWRHYFLSQFPQLSVICFTSYPDKEASTEPSKKVQLKFKRRGRGRLPSAVGPRELLRVVEKMYQGRLNLSGWQERIDSNVQIDQSDLQADVADSNSESEEEEEEEQESTAEAVLVDSSPLVKDEILEGVLTIGMVGHPNVGKSSIINGLMGKKLVSTSRTPGHTKHFQTIFLTSSVRLCDCPGLVFPSLVDKQLQILSGMYPIAQVRDPYTTVGYLAQRIPLIQLLHLQHPDRDIPAMASKLRGVNHSRQGRRKRDKARGRGGGGDGVDNDLAAAGVRLDSSDEDDAFKSFATFNATTDEVWTAWDICDAWAQRRGYYTSRAARLDSYRAANSLLRLAVDGRISLYFRPPEYSKNKEKWLAHPEVGEMIALQSVGLRHTDSTAVAAECLGKDNSDGGKSASDKRIGKPHTKTGANKFALLMDVDDNSD